MGSEANKQSGKGFLQMSFDGGVMSKLGGRVGEEGGRGGGVKGPHRRREQGVLTG